MMREVIRQIPDGTYKFRDFLDDDGAGTKNIPIEVAVKIKGGGAVVDFSGTARMVKGCLNTPLSVTTAATVYVFQCMAPAEMPLNSGPLRAIKIEAEKGTILHAQYPAAVVGGNTETSQRVVDVVFGALSGAAPERVPAASAGTMSNTTFGGVNPASGKKFAYYETIAGGMGGRRGKDGVSAVQTHMTNTLNTPIEALERELPVRIDSYSVRRGSGGAGRYNGGDGIVRKFRFLTDAVLSIITERRRHSPYGIEGGESGKRGRNTITRRGKRKQIAPKVTLDIKKGDVLGIETPGGGGWGKFSKRGGAHK